LKGLVRLASSSREQRERRMTILDGEHLVQSYAEAGGRAEVLAIAESALEASVAKALFESAPAAEKWILSDSLLRALSPVETPGGLVAVISIPDNSGVPSAGQSWLLLESIQDPGNVGAMLRTAAAAGVKDVLLSPGCAFAWSPKVMRAGQGAHFGLRINADADLPVAAKAFRGPVIATLPRAQKTLYEADLRGPAAWLFGAEGAGLSDELAACATQAVSIPMPGGTESLNVAAALAVCLFEQVRQRAG
jgi:TrmH family RNA methyltransferase